MHLLAYLLTIPMVKNRCYKPEENMEWPELKILILNGCVGVNALQNHKT